ncbi:MAG TPA: glycosyltransferase family 39 protein [Nannocystis sp.]
MPVRREHLAALAIAAIAGVSCLIRLPGFTEGGFASHDVGGILYESMLLRAGGLPYVDAIELKAPGTFYLATVLAGPEGRDIATFQIVANLVALASLLVLAALAWRLWGPRAAVFAAALYALHDAHLDSMDANYVTWAQLPQVGAALLALSAATRREVHDRKTMSIWTWTAAGALCGLAALCKQPSGAILIPVLFWAAFPPGRRDLPAAVAVAAGFLLAHAPVALHYLARGHLGDLVRGYVWNPWGFEYIARNTSTASPGHALWEFLAATAHFVALPLALAVFALATRPKGYVQKNLSHVPGAIRFLLVWTAAALLAAAVGLRFYKGYYLAVLPPLCLLAAAPWGAACAGLWRRGRVRLALAPLILVLVARAAWGLHATRVDRARSHDAGARKIGQFIRAETGPDDRIWVWGWHLWGVHAYSGRLAATRVYKALGLLTVQPDDTWRTPPSPQKMVEGGRYAAILLEDLAADPPAFIVLGGTVPRNQFTELRRFLAAHYVRDHRVRVGRVEIWRRKDHRRT